MEKFEIYVRHLLTMALDYLPRVFLSGLVLMIGWWLIGRVSRIASKTLVNLDISLRTFLISLSSIAMKVMLLISVAGMIGIQTTSFVAILGAAGLAIGLALQGTLANFAGGVLILFFKPYRVGDVIEAQGKNGTVKEIQIFNTILLTGKGETIILPNGAVSNGTIVNVTNEGRSLVEILIELDINTDLIALRNDLLPVIVQNKLIFDNPAPSISITAMKPISMTVAFRVYTLPIENTFVSANLLEIIRDYIRKAKIES